MDHNEVFLEQLKLLASFFSNIGVAIFGGTCVAILFAVFEPNGSNFIRAEHLTLIFLGSVFSTAFCCVISRKIIDAGRLE